MRSSRARTSNSPPRRARSCSTTRTSCSPTATAGKPRSRRTSRSTRPTGERDERAGSRAMIVQAICFYLFSAILVASAALVIAARNPVHSVLFLILAFFNAAGLFVLLGAEFLAMILVIVYVGAVAVLFLFVVMMLDIDFAELRSGFMRYLPIGALIGFVLLAELMLVFGSWVIAPGLAGLKAAPLPPNAANVTNTRALGDLLYTRYVFAFQAAGLILLVAMIGAIVLTLRQRVGVRRQRVPDQLARSRGEAVAVVKVPLGAGAPEAGE